MHNKLFIYKANLISNLKNLRQKIQNKELCFVIKGNAYGHGIDEIAEISKEYVDFFALFNLEEGLHVKKTYNKNVVVFDYLSEKEDIKLVIENEIQFFVSCLTQLNKVIEICKVNKKKAYIHLFFDTGMSREGFCIKELEKALILILKNQDYIQLNYLSSHFAYPSFIKENEKQISRLNLALNIFKKYNIYPKISFSSSALIGKNIFFDMVRVGFLLYAGDKDKFLPISSLYSEVLLVKFVKKGQTVSYENKYTLQKDCLVAVIGIGYFHGLKIQFSNKLQFLVNGKKYKQIGLICMDQCMIIADENVKIGDKVLVFSDVSKFSDMLNISAYETLTSINSKVKKIVKD